MEVNKRVSRSLTSIEGWEPVLSIQRAVFRWLFGGENQTKRGDKLKDSDFTGADQFSEMFKGAVKGGFYIVGEGTGG